MWEVGLMDVLVYSGWMLNVLLINRNRLLENIFLIKQEQRSGYGRLFRSLS